MAKTCSYGECTFPVWSQGYCKWHQWYRKNAEPSEESTAGSGDSNIDGSENSSGKGEGYESDNTPRDTLQRDIIWPISSQRNANNGLSKSTKTRGSKKRSSVKTIRGTTIFGQDKQFYNSIWNEREHICFNCGKYLGGEPLTLYFHHILEKRNFPEFRHVEWNIVLLCADCHLGYETYPNPKRFQRIIDLTKQLKEKYEL